MRRVRMLVSAAGRSYLARQQQVNSPQIRTKPEFYSTAVLVAADLNLLSCGSITHLCGNPHKKNNCLQNARRFFGSGFDVLVSPPFFFARTNLCPVCTSQHLMLTHGTESNQNNSDPQNTQPLRPQAVFIPLSVLGEENCCVTGSAQTQQLLFF